MLRLVVLGEGVSTPLPSKNDVKTNVSFGFLVSHDCAEINCSAEQVAVTCRAWQFGARLVVNLQGDVGVRSLPNEMQLDKANVSFTFLGSRPALETSLLRLHVR